ncbi:cation diffusion facilitator family transporter [Legionella sp. CNM-4043-24]|uniref:cation diffusion facilitator family transporter n=1 Tax=Legionella sp. CNM-4043-24 TaxID=3421646 RepID=UPI00403B12E2
MTERYWQAKKITLIGAGINALLGIIKVIGGWVFHSHALLADGVHSFSDLFTDIMVLFASKYGSQDADEKHPYGHQRIETAATLLLAMLLILAGFGIAWDAIDELISKSSDMPGWWALPIALISILANELLFHYTQHVGRRIKSQLIIANAWHHRSDAASSVVVTLGLLGSLAGFVYLDALAAVIVGGMIIQMGLSYGWNSVKELVDTSVEPEVLLQLEKIIQAVDGVEKIHQLRSRSMGSDILVDVHILVSPCISVSEGHFIAQHVHQALITQLDHVKDVTVHVDPEDDETNCPSIHLPSRSTIEKNLLLPWKQQFSSIRYWRLHYLDGTMRIDLILDTHVDRADELRARINSDLSHFPEIKSVRLFSEHRVLDTH